MVFRQAFVPARLPRLPGTHPALIAFYEAQLGDEEEPALGQRWFDLCSNHSALEYLSPTSGELAIAAAASSHEVGETESGADCSATGDTPRKGGSSVQYELLPTLQNVARTCGTLLGAEDAYRWQNLADLAHWWNALPPTKINGDNETGPSAATRQKLAVIEEMRSFRAPHGEEMLHRQHALLSLLPTALASDLERDSQSNSSGMDASVDQLKRPGDSIRRRSDPYDVSFPIHAGAKESDLEAAAAMESGGGIKLTLEEAHNISAVFHVPAPRPWLQPAQNAHLDSLLGRNDADNCSNVCARKRPGANVLLATVLPALLGGRWLEVPASKDTSLAVVTIMSARLSKGGELEAATSRAIYLALAVSSLAHCDQEGRGQQQQDQSKAHREQALCLALARHMIDELSAAEAAARGVESSGGFLLADTQLRLAEAVVAQATQATQAAAGASSLNAEMLLLETLPLSRQLDQSAGGEAALGKNCALLDAAVTGWVGGWHTRLFWALGWRDRLRLARFALLFGQRTPQGGL